MPCAGYVQNILDVTSIANVRERKFGYTQKLYQNEMTLSLTWKRKENGQFVIWL